VKHVDGVGSAYAMERVACWLVVKESESESYFHEMKKDDEGGIYTYVLESESLEV
jgi:hypothetical protein